MNNRGCFRLRARSGSPGSAAPRPSRTHRLVSVLDLDYIVTLPSHLCQVFSAKFITELWQHPLSFFSPVFRHFRRSLPSRSPFPPAICYKSSSPTCFRLVSILCRIPASVPPYFIFCHILTFVPPYSIFCHILTSVPPYSIFCCILASVPPYSRLLFATYSASVILSVYISV